MMASRGMGAISPSKMPKGKTIVRKDNPNDVEVYKEGGATGLYANIHAKRARGGKMRKPGDPGAPTADAFKQAAKTARK
jgi:hypothetical protein